MSERTVAYLITEGRGPETQPKILRSGNPNVCRFKVDTLQEGGIINRNKRRYRWDLLVDACNHPYVQERLSTGTFYCESGHPREKTVARQLRIEQDRVSCIIKEIALNKPRVGGPIVETASTRRGKDLMGLIRDNGCKVAFSMRGLGKVQESSGIIDVVPPLRIVCWDEVVHPSVPNAYMGEILTDDVFEPGKVDEESLIILAEDDFARYVLDASPDAKNALDALEVDPHASGNKIIVNEDGTLSIQQESETVICLTETFVRREIANYFSNRTDA